ncbi:glycosyltransferase [Pedobacter sp. MC2016-05]|uniref:glycosyltransferase n=1 Tax=Pedobacter sp. MC2016-05 TaxID=2994474 RepID=UPI0022480CFB|nr:glycosyltransferase [Pedobacter sp. MC2016-05]MCX2473189.1 glycosyltransferase [Pedobacter sp. MC2016-05]
MKVLHIINSLNTGGAEKLAMETLPLFNKIGITADIALLDGRDYPFKKELIAQNCCKVILLSKKNISVYNPVFIYRIMRMLSAYDLVHVHLFPAQYYVALAKIISFSKTKLVFTEHNTSNRRMEHPSLGIIERFIYRQYSNIICITSKVKGVLVRKIGLSENQLSVIENGINLKRIQDATSLRRTEFSFSEDDCLLIMVAAFRKQKDQDTIFRALKKLPTNYRLILAGDGERKQDLLNLSKQLGLENRIHFLGVRSDIPELIKMCDISILSSHWEGFGLAAAESMAASIPVIASDVEGLADIVRGGGLLFKKGDDEDLCRIIIELSRDSVLYNSTSLNGVLRSKRYDIQILVDKTVDLYRKILND